MKAEFDIKGLDGVLEMLQQLPPEIASKNGGIVRRALRKGAMVLVTQGRANFRRAVEQPGATGITDTTGFTEKQIVAKRRKMPGGMKGEKFVVTVNYVLHPNGNKYRGRAIRANDIAFTMEAGSSKQAATPWLRPAFDAKARTAIETATSELIRGIDRAVKKLAAKNKGR
jgi:hypothetical protein